MKALVNKIFSLNSESEFNDTALEVFRFQYKNNSVYQQFVDLLNIKVDQIKEWEEIPSIPIQFFKTHKVLSAPLDSKELFFASSGTTSQNTSKHYIADVSIYQKSLIKGFSLFVGNPASFCFIALLPNYMEQKNSSLLFMMNEFMKQSYGKENGFYKEVTPSVIDKIEELDAAGEKVVLWGVTYALLDLIEQRKLHLKNTLVFETGGMKGRRKEMVREELHTLLCEGFGVHQIASEYGMTEMFSQAYSIRNGVFSTPPWLKIKIHDIHNPKEFVGIQKTGGISVFDLANVYSCSFINTHDIGRQFDDNTFEVLGRFDNSDIRGCNLLYTS